MRNLHNTQWLVLFMLFSCGSFLFGQPLDHPRPLKSRQLNSPAYLLPLKKAKPHFSSTNSLDSLNVRLVGHWANGPCQAVAVVGNTAYFGNGAYLEIVDFSNPGKPVELGKALVPAPIRSVAISGSYAYVADGYDGLRVIDISNPINPQEMGYFDTGGEAFNVVVSGSYAYVADGYDGLRVIDISNPTKLQEVGYFDTGDNAYNDVVVSGAYAYVTAGDAGLRVIDISNPNKPQETGYFDTGDNAYNDVVVSGAYAYVTAGDAGLRVIDISNSSNPQEVGYFDTGGYAYEVAVSGDYAYLAAGSNSRVIDISNPTNPQEAGAIGGFLHGVTVSGNYAYAVQVEGGLRVFDISSPTTPLAVVDFREWIYASDVALRGPYAYAAYGYQFHSLRVLDISKPDNPEAVGTFGTGHYIQDVVLSGGYAYLADGEDGLYILQCVGSGSPPDRPNLSQPKNNGFTNVTTPSLSWQVPGDSDGDSLHFMVEIATDSRFTNQISGSPFASWLSTDGFDPGPPIAAGAGSCRYVLQDSLNEGIYYWRVSAWDGHTLEQTSALYNFMIDTQPPGEPKNLLANGANPSPVQPNSDEFTITWENPPDASGIGRYFYKIGAEPEHNYDTTHTVIAAPEFSPRMKVKAQKEFWDILTVWLEDRAGNVDYQNHSSVGLIYHKKHITSSVNLISPRPDEQLSDYVFILSNHFDFTIKNCALEYKINTQPTWNNVPEVPLDSMKNANQFIYVWNAGETIKDSVSLSLKLSVWDSVGNLYTDEVRFHLDPDSEIPTAIILTPSSEAFLHDSVSITGYALGKDFAHYSLSLSTKDQLLHNPLLKRSTSSRGDQGAEELLKLNTKAYQDGEYTLILEVQNKNGKVKRHAISVVFDNTPPTAKLLAPLEDDSLSCFVGIEGIAADSNFQSAILELWKYDDPTITTLDSIQTSGMFSRELNTLDLSGKYHLRLCVKDKAGLMGDDTCSYHIHNPRFDMRNGLTKTLDEFTLFIPPNGYEPCAICLEKRDKSAFNFPEGINPTDLMLQIHSDISETDSIFSKKSTLTINYHELDVNSYDEDKLRIYHRKWEKAGWKWELLGGTLDKNGKLITTTIQQIGIYGLCTCEKMEPAAEAAKDLQISFQPRIFSPKGGGYDDKTATSFELGKAADVTIKIYNAAGRLVRLLKKNENMPYGNNVVYWEGKDDWGNFCVSDLYIVTIQAEDKLATKTVVVLNK